MWLYFSLKHCVLVWKCVLSCPSLASRSGTIREFLTGESDLSACLVWNSRHSVHFGLGPVGLFQLTVHFEENMLTAGSTPGDLSGAALDFQRYWV